MKEQAMGVYSATKIIAEESLGKLPGDLSGKAFDIPFNSNTVSSSQNTTTAETMTGTRHPTEPIMGNISTEGTMELPLDTEAFGYVLAMAFGNPQTTGSKAPYTHIFKPGKKQPSFAVEKAFNNGVYALAKGCKVSKMGFKFGGDGELTVGVDVLGCDEELSNTGKANDAKKVVMNRLNNFQASLLIDKVESAIATELSLDIDFGLDEDGYAIGSNGFRTRINEGLIGISGKITTFFDDKGLLEKAIQSKKTALQLKLVKGNAELIIDLPEVLFARKTAEINGASGLSVDLEFNAFLGTNELNSSIQFTLKNSVATYPFAIA